MRIVEEDALRHEIGDHCVASKGRDVGADDGQNLRYETLHEAAQPTILHDVEIFNKSVSKRWSNVSNRLYIFMRFPSSTQFTIQIVKDYANRREGISKESSGIHRNPDWRQRIKFPWKKPHSGQELLQKNHRSYKDRPATIKSEKIIFENPC